MGIRWMTFQVRTLVTGRVVWLNDVLNLRPSPRRKFSTHSVGIAT